MQSLSAYRRQLKKIDLAEDEDKAVECLCSEKSITEVFEEIALLRKAQGVRLGRSISAIR